MFYIEDIWRSKILTFLQPHPPSCESSQTISNLRSTSKFFYELLLHWKPCRVVDGYCETHQPLYCYFHDIVHTIYLNRQCHHITFESRLQRSIFWVFLREQLKTDKYFEKYMAVLTGFKDCCEKSISPRIEVIPPPSY